MNAVEKLTIVIPLGCHNVTHQAEDQWYSSNWNSTQTDIEMIDISKIHAETNTEKIFG